MRSYQFQARKRAVALGISACVAIDAGCLALSGIAGLFAFGIAWLALKGTGII